MIIEFSLANFRSFHSGQTVSFRATGLTSEADEKNILYVDERNKFLKIVGVYGANASGKSNLIRGLSFMQEMVDSSLESESVIGWGFRPYRLAANFENNDGYFQIVLLLDGKKYRYGFTISDDLLIESEWLFGPAKKNETYYFKRKGRNIDINDDFFSEGQNLPKDKLRDQTLFLTFVASYNGSVSKLIKDFVSDKISIDSSQPTLKKINSPGPTTERNRELTDQLVNSGQKQVVINWMKQAGLYFSDVSVEKMQLSKNFTFNRIKLQKNVFDDKGDVIGSVEMDLESDESEGTQKFYSYIGDLYERFQNGGIFVSDEIDSNFHPSLLRQIICLFQDPSINRAGAQLFFTSHNTSLMNPNYMRRDQFYFTEKSIFDETRVYSLADLKGIRNHADFAQQYLSGFYGALPQLGSFLSNQKA
ncbi:AAA family ATPase [Dyadobacter pollutisoli]|uniref:ATP-binding protein n=1 Tax=Dyadobacter pollutisoli TaxID=2910158 RepID=A0A9E8SPG8_9BACT|nr:ATP-binding protein [Dyadobacter pollutisoli]WAC15344.1 ATP-binding protein [Dyadobacter pollutisoli]